MCGGFVPWLCVFSNRERIGAAAQSRGVSSEWSGVLHTPSKADFTSSGVKQPAGAGAQLQATLD